ncbi:MAG: mono/diheme cytochrome c family protein, partial [Paraglaciecola sp.]
EDAITEESSVTHTIFFDQGWTRDQALDFYNTSQGSQLLPYAWFLVLEQHDNKNLFRDNENMRSFGYIPQDKISGVNPDGLPIGFVIDNLSDPILNSGLIKARLSPNVDDNNQGNSKWLGLTCAACHTSEIRHDDKIFRIDGGPPMSDMQTLLQNMSRALQATSSDDEKLTRFAKNILSEGSYNEIEKNVLKKRLDHFTGWINNYINVNYAGLVAPYGYGRLDAFGAILNRVTTTLLEIPSNGTPASAPVSYPFLWNTSQLDWVQWNGSVNNHIGRNIGEVTGVFARTILTTDNEKDRFYSSANLRNLDRLEQLMSQLDSPKWTQQGATLPPIDHAKAEKGQTLFKENCLSCHGVRDEQGQFPMTSPNKYNKQFIEITMTPLNEIGTDPMMAMNFVNPEYDVDPGQMRKYIVEDVVGKATQVGKSKGLAGPALAALQEQTAEKYQQIPTVPRALVLSAAGKRIIGRKFAELGLLDKPESMLAIAGFRDDSKDAPNFIAYKGRPLNGIWATAPYMHNGSMANLYQTLLPESEREASFYVGSNVFDPKHVGFESSQEGNHFKFETVDEQGKPISGNSNEGHAGNTFTKTLDADGQWVDFTDVQRFQLIEYMKTL